MYVTVSKAKNTGTADTTSPVVHSDEAMIAADDPCER